MNAVPFKNPEPLTEVVDELVASFGLRRVLLAVAARLFRKQHPPDRVNQTGKATDLSDHLRKDIGLPVTHEQQRIDPLMLHRH